LSYAEKALRHRGIAAKSQQWLKENGAFEYFVICRKSPQAPRLDLRWLRDKVSELLETTEGGAFEYIRTNRKSPQAPRLLVEELRWLRDKTCG
jgi:hypothetical protein